MMRRNDPLNKGKEILASDCLNAYSNYKISFHIYTNASKYQLVSIIIQKSRPILFYIMKLTDVKQPCTTTEK